jgi:membrane fusion protein, heavy metal efflux system
MLAVTVLSGILLRPREAMSLLLLGGLMIGWARPALTSEHGAPPLEARGTVRYDGDHYAIAGCLISGRVVALHAGVGDRVRQGQLLAELESADASQAQATFIQATGRHAAAASHAHRERELASSGVSSTRDLQRAEAEATAGLAILQAARLRLEAIGLGAADIDRLRDGREPWVRVPVRAAISGTIVARAVTIGQTVEPSIDLFHLADLSRAWVILDVPEANTRTLHPGQRLAVHADARPGVVYVGRVSYIAPIIDERTRTVQARVQLTGIAGRLRPGQLVSARTIDRRE